MKEYKLKINGNDYAVTIADIENSVAEVEVNGIPFKVEFDSSVKKTVASAPKQAKPVAPAATASRPAAPAVSPVTPPSASSGTGNGISSPLPGVILEVCVKEGDTVKRGQKLMVLEAMKMENVIESNADGKVISIKVNKGDSVLEGATLVTIG